MIQNKKFKLVISILVSLLLLAVGFGVFAISSTAADSTMSTLEITITDGADYGKIYITIGTEAREELQSGKIYQYPNGTRYTLSVEPLHNGYKAAWNGGQPSTDGTFGGNQSYEMAFVPKTFNVSYVNESLYGFQQAKVESYTYGEETPIVNPHRSGYNLTGWKVYDRDPAQSGADCTTFQKPSIVFGKDITPQYDCWLEPIFTEIEYYVIRLDVVFDSSKPYNLKESLGYELLSGPMNAFLSGADGTQTAYAGYEYLGTFDYEAAKIQITNFLEKTPESAEWYQANLAAILQNPSAYPNVVFRYYQPIKYPIEVNLNGANVSFEDGDVMPQIHVFDENTTIPSPVRVGYEFLYWEVSYLQADGTTYTGKGGASYVDYVLSAKTCYGEIRLTAVWQAKEYTVKYDWNGKDADDNAVIAGLNNTLLTQFGKYTYDSPVAFPYAKRTGYTFLGWTVTLDGASEPFNTEPLLTLPDELFSQAAPVGFTLKANWVATDYTVTLDGNGATEAGTPTIGVTFDAPMNLDGLVLPKRFGYKFLGYGTKADGTGTLYINPNGTATVALWNIDQDTTLYAVWEELPHVNVPAFEVDYLSEIFTVSSGIPDGHYEFKFGETVLDVVVLNGEITVNTQAATKISIPEAFFGQTVTLKVFGDGTTTSHSYVNLPVAARPKAPAFYEEIKDISEDYTVIKVILMQDLPAGYVYEFALSKKIDIHENDLIWQDSPVFDNCTPGTIYYVFIRVKASEGNYAHGLVAKFESTTYHATYVEQKVNDLLSLKQEGDGSMVEKLIADAIAEVRAQAPSETFYEDIEAIYDRVVIEIVFARQQDESIAELTAMLDAMKASGTYSNAGIDELIALYNAAIEQIKNAEKSDAVQNIYNTVVLEMKEIKITHLQSGDLDLTASNGMRPGTQLNANRHEVTGDLSNAVDASIKLGSVSMNGVSMTLEEALRALSSKDVMAWYSVQLTDGVTVLNNFDGTYTFRLYLQEDLRNIEGLQIAYYNQKTGELEVLDTHRDGNCLVFSANRVADFVIMGDPIINLTGLIGALGAVLLLQVIAIALLLIRRKKVTVLQSSALLPMVALTIRVFPANALTIVLILGILVLLLQVLLIYLLLTSDLRFFGKHKPKKKGSAKPQQPYAQPAFDEAEESTPDADTTAVFVAVEGTEETALEDAELADEDTLADPDAEAMNVFAEDDADAALFAEEGDFEDFIEPAANPNYSLEDEDAVWNEEVATEDGDEPINIDSFEEVDDVIFGEQLTVEDAEYAEDEMPPEAPFEMGDEEPLELAFAPDEDLDESDELLDGEELVENPLDAEPVTGEDADLFAFDDEDEDLATGAPYYDEEVPLHEDDEEDDR